MLLSLRLRPRFLSQALALPVAARRRPVHAVRHMHSSSHSFAGGGGGGGGASDEELHAARKWLAELHAEAIPLQSIGELSFSRSSGPGGQNVNKYDQL